MLFQSMFGREIFVAGNANSHVGSEKDSSRNKEEAGVFEKMGKFKVEL